MRNCYVDAGGGDYVVRKSCFSNEVWYYEIRASWVSSDSICSVDMRKI